MQKLSSYCHSDERSDEESTISPPAGADRGMQNGIAAMIRVPSICHSERREESKIHDRKT